MQGGGVDPKDPGAEGEDLVEDEEGEDDGAGEGCEGGAGMGRGGKIAGERLEVGHVFLDR